MTDKESKRSPYDGDKDGPAINDQELLDGRIQDMELKVGKKDGENG